MVTTPSSTRRRNARGQGERLRDEIVAATLAIVERDGMTDNLTLRAVAREIGIAAPSIYRHFPDLAAILSAAVDEVFAELIGCLHDARARAKTPARRLESSCEAYLTFAATHPHPYRLLFNRSSRGAEVMSATGREAFGVLVQAVRDTSAYPSPTVAATAIWAGLHGIATLRVGAPAFAWPTDKQLLRALLAAGRRC